MKKFPVRSDAYFPEWKPAFTKVVKICLHEARFPLGEQRKKQLDWLATNTDDITSQSHSLFACSREKNRQVANGSNTILGVRKLLLTQNFSFSSCIAKFYYACLYDYIR